MDIFIDYSFSRDGGLKKAWIAYIFNTGTFKRVVGAVAAPLTCLFVSEPRTGLLEKKESLELRFKFTTALLL